MKKKMLLSFLMLIILAGCQAKDPPMGAIIAALHFCPVDECEDIKLGNTTKPLPFSDPSIYDHWCVDVRYKLNGKAKRAAVEVFQIDPNAPTGLGDWSSSDPIFNADCKIFDTQ